MKILKEISGGSKSVLVVDDEVDLREIMVEHVNSLHLASRVDTAENGIDAFGKLTQHAYSVLITDLRMPEVDGKSLVQSLKNLSPGIRPKSILIVSALIDEPGHESTETGQEIYTFPKPIDTALLESVLRKVL